MPTNIETLRRTQVMEVYTVEADAETGEWMGDPSATGESVNSWDWANMEDTDAAHYDTYVYDADTQAERALIVTWAA